MNYRDAYERYCRDATFHAMVDAMVASAIDLKMSPGELREAAVFAEGFAYEKFRMIEMRRGFTINGTTYKLNEEDSK